MFRIITEMATRRQNNGDNTQQIIFNIKAGLTRENNHILIGY